MKTLVFKIDITKPDQAIIQQASQFLHEGKLVAFPTETVYGLGANALNSIAVASIFEAKGRPASDPIIAHIHTLDQLEQIATDVPELAYQLADLFWPGPLTMVLKRSAQVPANVSAGMDTIAVRMPSHPIAQALLQTSNLPIAAPSANRFARPSATTAQHVLEDLDDRIDMLLDGGATMIGLESTIVDLTKTPPNILRPGGVSVEALRTVLPTAELVSKHLKPEDAGIEAPGMLLKHYSPQAELLLFDGTSDKIIRVMREQAEMLVQNGKKVGLLTRDDEKENFDNLPVEIVSLGSDLETIGHNLFNGMRTLDHLKVDVILVHGYERAGLGAALWDRLLRAAEGRVINV